MSDSPGQHAIATTTTKGSCSIRILVVDDHPSVRAGLVALLRTEPGLEPVAAARGVEDAWHEYQRHVPDVMLVDYLMRDGDGIELCRRVKGLQRPPAVLIHTAFTGASLAVAATIAGADGIVDKGYSPEALFAVLRSVARGDRVLPPPAPEALSAIASRLDDRDLPILGMLVARIPTKEIAQNMHVRPKVLESRIAGILDHVQPSAS